MARIESWWKYDSLLNRLLGKKTFYHYVIEEDYTVAFNIRKNGDLEVVYTGQGKGRTKK